MLDLTRVSENRTYQLSTGTLHLRISPQCEAGLFRVAERINPKRSFLFVSDVLGRHVPVRPSDHFRAVRSLLDRFSHMDITGPVLVMGYAETAVGLGAAVAREIARRNPGAETLYLSTTRHRVPGRSWLSFSEGHSHATDHEVMRPDPHPSLTGTGTLVLVDDEATTGSTFLALLNALLCAGLRFRRILLMTLTDWSEGASERAVRERVPDTEVRAVSLMSGGWSWERDPSAPTPTLPFSRTGSGPTWVPTPGLSPRCGIRSWADGWVPLSDQLSRRGVGSCRSVLVIGTGEHVWGPMRIGEELEAQGADVRVLATTRSPILEGEVIRHKITFPDHFGIGVPMYLHNVPPRPDADVLLMTETGADRICNTLRSHIGRGLIIDGSGRITEFYEP
jgi:hypothetical protein